MKNRKIRLYKILFMFLIIMLIFVIILILKKYIERNKYETENKEMVQLFNENKKEEKDLKNLEFQGYRVIGIIKIPKIELEYPILEETTKDTMNKSISRFWGGEINSYGNVSLAGHNNKDGTMFGKNKILQIGDIIKLTDLSGKEIEYSIYNIFSTDPNDVTILKTDDENVREVTLITCTNGRASRLIIKAKEL